MKLHEFFNWLDAIALGILSIASLILTLAIIQFAITWLVKAVN